MPDNLRNFLRLFTGWSISTETIRVMFTSPDGRHEKIISVCMGAAVALVCSPLLLLLRAFRGDLFTLAFLLAIIVFFIYSFIVKGKFSLIGMGVIAALKLVFFRDAAADALIALAAVLLIYLLCGKEK